MHASFVNKDFEEIRNHLIFVGYTNGSLVCFFVGPLRDFPLGCVARESRDKPKYNEFEHFEKREEKNNENGNIKTKRPWEFANQIATHPSMAREVENERRNQNKNEKEEERLGEEEEGKRGAEKSKGWKK